MQDMKLVLKDMSREDVCDALDKYRPPGIIFFIDFEIQEILNIYSRDVTQCEQSDNKIPRVIL